MKDLQREILNQVASRTISAEEGAARLEALEADGAPVKTATPPPADATAAATRQVKVVSQFGSADIVGDPSVAFVVADGPHRVRQDGDTMVIEHQAFDDNDTFAFGVGKRRVEISGFDVQRRRLVVRMNPDLTLIATVQAGSLRVDGVHGPITAEVQAGSCKIADFRSALNVSVQAGDFNAVGRLDAGDSKVRCEMGSVKINLQDGSSVRITARTTLGKIAIEDGAGNTVSVGQAAKVVTIGGGAGTLDCDCTMGNVKVTAE